MSSLLLFCVLNCPILYRTLHHTHFMSCTNPESETLVGILYVQYKYEGVQPGIASAFQPSSLDFVFFHFKGNLTSLCTHIDFHFAYLPGDYANMIMQLYHKHCGDSKPACEFVLHPQCKVMETAQGYRCKTLHTRII